MAAKQIKLKFTLTHLNDYAGGAEKFLNDLKTAYASIMRIADKQTGSDVFSFGLAFFPQDDPNHFYSGETDDCQKLNQINSLTIYRVENNLIPDTPIAPKSIKQTKNDKDTENIIINDSEEIATLKLEFLNLDNTVYDMPDYATIDGNELEISFLEAVSHTITFTNTTHGEFDVDLPLPINVPDGENILLPSVSGLFEDEGYIYTPSQWDIGEFGESIYPTQDMTADLMWYEEAKTIKHTITFTNTTHSEFDVDFPNSITVDDGESVLLPSVSGSFEDSGYEYTPLEWSIGAFGESFTPTDDVTANLLWKAEEIKPALPEVSSRNDFGDYNWLFVNTNLLYKTIQPNADEQLVFSISKSPAPYDSSKSYGVMIVQQYENGASGDSTLFSIINYSDTIGVKNISSNAVEAYAFRIAICSSSQAIIVVVYSSNNTAYNAFKYTLDGVDYYYILDGTQTNWTDDLSSIGYFLYPYEEITLYTYNGNKNVQPSVTSSYNGNVNTSYLLSLWIEKAGATFTYDLEKQYEFGYYNDSDEWVRLPSSIQELPENTSEPEKVAYIMHDNGRLWICSNSENPSPVAFATDGVVKVRARKLNKMYITLYVNTDSIYDNKTCNRGQAMLYGTPSLGVKSKIIPWQFDNTFPQITLEKVLGSTGNEIDKSNITLNRTAPLSIYINQASTSLRSVLLSLDNSTFRGYLTTYIYEYLS
jgi:hypothetical protein